MSTCLYIEFADGSVQVITSQPGWKSALDATGHWQAPAFDDTSWKPAGLFQSTDPEQNTDRVHPWPTGPVKMLRHTFNEASPVRSARLYATALGAYKFWINGNVVGDEILAPGWTDFRNHVEYQTYDVTSSVKRGANAIGAYLAPGWYTTPLMWLSQPYQYGNTPPALKAQLRIEHTDGSVEWIATDASWKADVSPILQAEIYDGETYDARREQPGWSTASFDDSKWKNAKIIEPTEPAIVAQDYQPIRIEKAVAAKTITNPKPGVYVVDFGQNLAGVARLHLHAAAGTDVKLRFAELLNPDGTIYVDNLRSAKATDHYIFSASTTVTYQPIFTFHGFRYVEVTGLQTKPELGALTAEVFHTDAPFTVELHTGSPMLNKLWSNILWGQRSNFVGVPTDCPQRDERLGWTGDAQVFWRAASYDMNLTQFSKKFAADLRGTQSDTGMYGIFAPGTFNANPGFAAGWSDAGVIVPWTSWTQSGDTRIIEQNWSAMQKYLATIEEESPKYIWEKSGIDFGDWLSPEGTTRQPLLATAYWAHDVSLMQQMAHATGRTEDEQKYAALHEKIKTAFEAEFVHADGFVAGGKPGSPLKDTQTGYVLALAMHLVPDDQRSAVAQHLVSKLEANGWHLGTGFLGTPYLLYALADTGHTDVAYRLLLSTEYPGWGYLVDHGATTMWERWNGDKKIGDPSMNSYNHYAYGAVADWIYRYAAGIDFSPLDAGFHTIYLHPHFDKNLGSLDFGYQSPYGPIQSSWKTSGNTVVWKLTIPPNSTGRLPVAEAHDWRLNGAAIATSSSVHEANGDYEIPAGTYAFTAKIE
jgi:alpha-L-rhamnosidase